MALLELLGILSLGAKIVQDEIRISKRAASVNMTYNTRINGDLCKIEIGSGDILQNFSDEARRDKVIMNGYDSYNRMYIPTRRIYYYDLSSDRWFELYKIENTLSREIKGDPDPDVGMGRFYICYFEFLPGNKRRCTEIIRISMEEYTDHLCSTHNPKKTYIEIPEEHQMIPEWRYNELYYLY